MMESVGLKESIYNIKIKLKGERCLLYNSLSRSLSLMEPEDAEELKRVDNGSSTYDMTDGFSLNGRLKNLCDQGFVLPTHVDELGYVKKFYGERRFGVEGINFTICPTMACNFGCDYCFQGEDKSAHVMSPEVMDGIIGLYHKILETKPDLQHVQFIWYGGEPLVKKKVIYELADKLINITLKKNISYNANMVSNGYLMDKKVAQEMFLRGLRTVQITLDGSEEYHDTRRHLLSKKGTYRRILKNIEEWIGEIPITVNLRVNIDERNKDGIYHLIDDLAERGLSNRENFTMYFSPVESITMGCHSISDKMMEKMNYGQLEAKLYRYSYRKGLTEVPYPPSFLGICSALRPYDFIMVPNGDVHKCWDTVSFPEKKVGSVFDYDALLIQPNPAKQVWDDFDPFENEICSSCKLLPNCASYCAHKFIHAADAAGEAILPCPSIKYSLNERLVLKAETEGFITKDDYNPEEIKTDPYELTPKMHTVESMKKSKYTDCGSLKVLEATPA